MRTSPKQKNPLRSFAEVIALWPFARDLAEDIGVEPEQVRTWKSRNNVPPEYWRSVVDAAGKRGSRGENPLFNHVRLELLALLAEADGQL